MPRPSSIPSPCISVCVLDAGRDMCVGCYRSRAEIGEWSRADDDRRWEISLAADARRIELTKAQETAR